MAEASSSRAGAAVDTIEISDKTDDKIEMQLWQACAKADNFDRIWYQDDLVALGVTPKKDLRALLTCITKLVTLCLFRTMESRDGRQCWKLVPIAKATEIRKLTENERIVYYELEAAGTDGMWIKAIRQRSGVPVADINAAMKKLESKGIVKPFTSAKYPIKKLYILAELQPNEDAAGGLFYSDGVVDVALLGHLCQWTEVFVHRKAWQGKEKPEPDKNGKRKRSEFEDPADAGILSGSKRWKGVKPMPAGYQGYATVGEIGKYLNKAGILKTEIILDKEVEQILELLCYDGRIEKVVGANGYRTILRPIGNPYEHLEEAPKNGFGEVPCGGCPAFDLCDETGPVNARTCEYFEDWL